MARQQCHHVPDTLYHVTAGLWDGSWLVPIAVQRERGSLTLADMQALAGRYDMEDDAIDAYIQSQGWVIHMHATLAEAQAFARDYAPHGEILQINAEDLGAYIDTSEYPHPVIRGSISPDRIIRVRPGPGSNL